MSKKKKEIKEEKKKKNRKKNGIYSFEGNTWKCNGL